MGYFLYKLESALKIKSPGAVPSNRMLARARRRGLFVFVLYILPDFCVLQESAHPRKNKRGILPQASCLGKGKQARERQRLFMEV